MLTLQQKQNLKAYVLATPALAALGRNDTELSNQLNADSSIYVWRSTTSADAIADAILWDRLTPIDAPDGTVLQTNRLLLCQAKQMNLQVLLQGRDSIGTGRQNLRNGLSDALLNVPSGINGATQDAGWIGAGRVKVTITRQATVAESIFVTGVGTVGNPASLGFEGSLSISDIGDMWNEG